MKEPICLYNDPTIKIDGGGISFSLRERDYKDAQCIMTYQTVTGALSQGAHPGGFNGQDAYNDMLVIDDGTDHGNRAGKCRNNVGGVPNAE